MNQKLLHKLPLALPFLLGLYGFMACDGLNFLDAAFNSVSLYLMNYGDTPENIFVELARWVAPLATVSGIIMAFEQLNTALKNKIRYFRGNSVAVYGDAESKEIILSQLGKNGIEGRESFTKAGKYIFVGPEEDNLRFLSSFANQIGNAPVYVRARSLKTTSLSGANVKLWSPEELSARLFWKQNFLYPLFKSKAGQLNIVIVGFGDLGEELLLWGLQNLIFSPAQEIQYHIFGDGSKFTALHPMLPEISDTICFHAEPWYENKALCDSADLLVLAQQENQTELVSSMLSVLTRQEVHVFAANPASLQLLDGHDRLKLFSWKQEAQQLDLILDDQLLRRAKAINLRYAHLYSGVEETDENGEKEWAKLSAFTRYSNISSADYHEVRMKMLQEMQTGPENADTLELLSHLEHIRWCRYHYLSNWSYGIPDNGKAKDPEKRIHRDLVPYEHLTEGEKEKDRENIRVLMSI